jgi:hypothetical protein
MRFLIAVGLLVAALAGTAAASEESNFASSNGWERGVEIQAPGD